MLSSEPQRRIRRAAAQASATRRAGRSDSSPVLARTQASRSRFERASPTRTVAFSFLVLIGVGTTMLMLPWMRTGGGGAPTLVALFTATSAACVTGLAVVDTATYWSPLGQVCILVLIQIGGFGMQALGTLWILLLNRRIGAKARLATQTETGALTPGDVRRVLKALGVITLAVEGVVALALTLRFWLGHDLGLGRAAWFGLFHAVSAFNNAGFALASDSLISYADDLFVLIPISAAIILGGLGFLVIVELANRATGGKHLFVRRKPTTPRTVTEVTARGQELSRRSRYRLGDLHPERLGFANPVPLSLHTRIMLFGTILLICGGAIGFAMFEWGNPSTLGPMPWWERALQSVFSGGITARTAGFNSVDYAQVTAETRFLTDGLMFIGAGSGSTGGGVKITTIAVLVMAVLAEATGRRDVVFMDRRIPDSAVRVAIAVVMVSSAAIALATMALIWLTNLSLDLALFEVISALATVGLSANVTPTLPGPAQLLLVVLMFLGRVGPLTLASSLSLRSTPREFRLPEGRPMVG